MDLDGDGKMDLISGNYVTDNEKGIGRVYLLKGLGDGKFATPTEVKRQDGKPIIPAKVSEKGPYDLGQICIHPFAADWDGDDDLDLIIGNFEGSFSLVLNEKSESGMSFANDATLLKDTSGNKLKCASAHSAPFVIDWDADGDLDLLSGDNRNGLSWAENVGRKTEPKLLPMRSLITIKRNPIQKLGDIQNYKPGSSFRPWIADVNSDGKLDVLLGDNVQLTQRAEGISDQDYAKKEKAWNDKAKELGQAMGIEQKKVEHLLSLKELNDEQKELMKPWETLRNDFSVHYHSRSEFISEKSTGHVWLFLAK